MGETATTRFLGPPEWAICDITLSCCNGFLVASTGLSKDMTIPASVMSKAHFWERNGRSSLSKRQQLVVNRLLDGFEGKLTSSKWAMLTKCSQDTALSDIDDLVRRGVLVKEAAGGRSTSYSLVEAE